jgi:UDP-N-acetylglucosamine 2-epimerase (non-hydrolysing)/GDP/UDP-N,N'-diacetylbacillosamine 2-epimerase (hydrolysing)
MTKLSHIHFTTNSQASNRILSMGEESWRVHTVGFPAIDLISQGNYASPIEIIKKLKLDLSKPIILFTQHSVTTEFNEASNQLKPSLLAIEDLSKKDLQVICTYPNNDAGGKAIILDLEKFIKKKIKGLQLHRSLGRYLYHGVLALAIKRTHRVVCVGNSSSGIKETPFFGCPTVNIGSRQEGRLRGKNVIDTGYNRKEIKYAIEKCLYDENFRKKSEKTFNPYYIGNTGVKIANKLASIALGKKILRKKMTIKGKEKNGWYQ